MILEAHGLSKRYGRKDPWALFGIDLSVAPGGITALVGPNGAGKSTLLRTWMGFERPTRGHVRVSGHDPTRERSAAISQVGYVPQTSALYRDLTVADHLGFAAHYRPRTFDRPLAERRLADLGVALDARAGTLSGGQAAQVGLAVALGLRAPVLLLDEPLAGLDPLARREFIDVLVDDVRGTGATVVLSSHVISDIEQACDRLIVLGVGRAMLVDSIAHARDSHRVLTGPAPTGTEVVAPLPGSNDRTLVRADEFTALPDAQSPTLEDVVMGYLAAARGGE